MRCLIVDDEPEARKLLSTYLSSIPGCTVAGSCRNAMEAYEALHTGGADLVFLDIKMPVVTGTDFLRSLKSPPLVVFTTAYDKYAMEGYELNVVDYLLKPLSLPRLLQAVDKAKERLKEKVVMPQQADYTFVRSESKLVKILFREIRYVEGMENYIRIHLAGTVVVAPVTMKAFEQLLPDAQFVRIHRSYIAAIDAITAIRGGQVEMGELTLPVGVSYKEQLMKTLGQ